MHNTAARLIYYGLQPLLLAGLLSAWIVYGDALVFYPLALILVQVVLGVLEHYYMARPEWRQPAWEKFRYVLAAAVLYVIAASLAGVYDAILTGPLATARKVLGLTFWPHHWPAVVQLLLVFGLSELLWYWLHRAEHRFSMVWRLTGHGAHHAFKRLAAINFGLNHPLELFVLLLPSALIELLFGVGLPAAGAALLVGVQASIVHANLHLNSRLIGHLLTTNEYHIHHHSVVLEESNTNYGCATIIWDRLFGTFATGRTLETGTGPTEPTLWEKFLMPWREPEDTQIAPWN
ncbi:MAG: sterol desaturase family protein [Pseudomonadales bacterium]